MRVFMLVCFLGLGACGGPQKIDTAGLGNLLAGFDPLSVTAKSHTPEAYTTLPMARYKDFKLVSVDEQKKLVAKAKKPEDKERALGVLATILWDLAQADEEEAADYHKDSRDSLRAYYEMNGKKAGPVLLYQLGITEIWNNNDAGATEAFAALAEQHPEHPNVDVGKAWATVNHLRKNENDKATKLVNGWEPTNALGHYAVAWTNFRNRSFDGVEGSLAKAASAWPFPAQGAKMVSEMHFIVASAGVPLDKIESAYSEILAGVEDEEQKKAAMVGWYFHVAAQLAEVGRLQDSIDAYEKILEWGGEGATPLQKTTALHSQGVLNLRIGNMTGASEKLRGAVLASKDCGADEQCSATGKRAVADLLKSAGHADYVFRTTRDPEAAKGATEMYDAYLAEDPSVATQQKEAIDGKTGLAAAEKAGGKGALDKDIVRRFLELQVPVFGGCYGRVLEKETTLEGESTLTLEVEADGSVTSANTEPGAGEEGMAAVGGCIKERALKWKFPTQVGGDKSTISFLLQFGPTK